MQVSDDRIQAESGFHPNSAWIRSSETCMKSVPNVQWRTPDDGQRRSPKHIEFYGILTLLGYGHQNLHETYQCRMYSGELLMIGKEDARNM